MTVSDSPLATVEVMDAATQEVAVEARGPDVLNISGNVATPKDPDEVMPDWVDLIVAAINLGMMSGAVLPPWSSRASVAKRIFEPVTARMQWNVALEQVDRGVFLVIMDVLHARRLYEASLRTLIAPPDARRLDVRSLTYPGRYRDVPFEIRTEVPLRTTRNRMLQIVFAQSPSDEQQKLVASAFDIWGQLLILGAYAGPERHPQFVHTLPDFAYWSDEIMFVQPFEEAFESDEACFDGIVGWAARVHHQGMAVRSITIV